MLMGIVDGDLANEELTQGVDCWFTGLTGVSRLPTATTDDDYGARVILS